MGNFSHADFRVTHGRGVVAVHRTKVTLTVNQHVTQAKILRHPDDGVVHRRVAMWVVFTNHITNDTRGFFIRFIVVIAKLVHGVKHASVHWLQAIPHIGQGATDDHAHGVIEIRSTHLVF